MVVRYLKSAHNSLADRFLLYKKWHSKRHSSKIHSIILGFYSLTVVCGLLISFFSLNGTFQQADSNSKTLASKSGPKIATIAGNIETADLEGAINISDDKLVGSDNFKAKITSTETYFEFKDSVGADYWVKGKIQEAIQKKTVAPDDSLFAGDETTTEVNLAPEKKSASEIDREKITYDNVVAGVDIEQKVYDKKIKEALIVENKEAPTKFQFELTSSDNLEIKQQGNQIAFTKKGEEKALVNIERAFANDQTGKEFAFKYSLSGSTLILEPDADLSEVVYPLVIDPSYTVVTAVGTTDYNNQRKLARDSSGNIYATYHRNSGTADCVYVAKSTDGGQNWVETLITEDDSYYQRYPSIAVDGSGYVHVAWQGLVGDTYGISTQIRYRKFTTSWQAIVNITGANYAQSTPAIAVDANNYINLVWAGTDASHAQAQIWYRQYTSSWQTVVGLTNEARIQATPAIAVDSNNYLHVVWKGRNAASTGAYQIRYINYTSSWQSIQELTTDNSNNQGTPSIAISNDNYLHVVFPGMTASFATYDQIRYLKYTTSWQAVVNWTHSADWAQYAPTVSADAANIHIVWYSEDNDSGGFRFVRYREYTTSWQAVTTIINNASVNRPCLMFATYPISSGQRVSRPGVGYTFLYTATSTLTILNSADLSWTDPPTTTVPDPPTDVSASAGDTQATVSFTAPANNGGADITGYTVTSTPGSLTGTGASSPIDVTGLTNGVEYTFTVHATNSVGDSSESTASAAVTPVAPGVTISGTVYTAEDKATNIGANKTVALSINGAAATTAETDANGAFSFSSITVAADNTVALYLDGETEKGSLVTQAVDVSTDITTLELFTSHVNLTHQTAGPMTNTLLATADNVSDTDLLVSVDGSSVATFTADNTLWIITGKSYTPGGAVSADSLLIAGTLDVAANALNVSGNLTNTGTLTTSGTTTFNGTTAQAISPGVSSFANVIISNTSAAVSQAAATTITGTLTIDASAVFATAGNNITIATLTNNGTFRETGGESTFTITNKDTTHGTIDYNGSGTYTSLNYGNAYNNITFSGSGSYTLGASATAAGTATVSAGTVTLANDVYTLTTAPFVITGGTFTIASQGTNRTKLVATSFSLTTGTFNNGNYSYIDINGAFTQNSGIITNSSTGGRIYVSGDFNYISGTYPTTGSTLLDGNSANFVNGPNGFGIFNVAKTAGQTLTLLADLYVAGDFYYNSGTFATNGMTIKMVGDTSNIYGNSVTVENLQISGLAVTTQQSINISSSLIVDADKKLVLGAGGSTLVTLTDAARLTLNGTIDSYALNPGRIVFTDDSATNLTTAGTMMGRIRFLASAKNISIPARTYGGRIDIQNDSSTDRVATLGTAEGQTITFGNGLRDDAYMSGLVIITNGTGKMTVDSTVYNPTVNVITSNTAWNYGDISFLGTGSGQRILKAGNSTWNVAGDIDCTNGVLTPGTSTFVLTGAASQTQNITSNGQSFYNLTSQNTATAGTIFADSATVTGTFTDITPSSKLTFHAASTYTFANINISGQASGTKVVMISSSTGNHYHFNVANATPTVSYANVKDADSSGGNTVRAFDGTNTDSLNNTNWVFTVAGAPTAVSAVAGNASAEVSFTAPADTGGGTISGYTVTSTPGSLTGTGATSPITVSGLTNGVAYTFTVHATTIAGDSAESSASVAVTPVTTPDAPTDVSAVAGNASAEVSFTAPADDGGATISGYTVTSTPGSLTGTGATSPITVSGLTNGVAYTFTVHATNSVGDSLESLTSNSITPIEPTVPGAPIIGTATAGNVQVSVTFTPPADDGGATISGYTVTSTPGSLTGTGATSPITVSGLTNGVAYTFTVHATNSVGDSLESSASNSATPAAVPDAPTAVSAVRGNTQATITFTPPASDGGAAISGYTATSTPGSITGTSASSPIVVTGLTNGVSYTFTVHATNSLGDSAESSATSAVIPATVPGAPTIGVVTAGNGQVSVAFSAPGSNGGLAISSYTVTSTPGSLATSGATSPIIVSGLTNGMSYTFTVYATNDVGNSPNSSASSSSTPYSVPGAPTVTTLSAGSINIVIDQNSNPSTTRYAIAVSTDGNTWSYVKNSNGSIQADADWQLYTAWGSASGFANTGLVANTLYQYKVKAKYDSGAETDFSTIDSDTTGSPAVGFSSSAASGSISVAAVSIPISIDGISGVDIGANYAVTGGTALQNTDFTFSNGTGVITAGSTSTSASLVIINNHLVGSNKTIEFTLSSPTNASLSADHHFTYTIINDNVGPTGAFTINAGASKTKNQSITLAVTNNLATEVKVSQASDFAGSSYQAVAAEISYNLSAGDGAKSIYLKFKDQYGNESQSYSGSITLDQTAPEVITNLVAIAGSGSISLSWSNPSTADLAKSKIYRSTVSGFEIANATKTFEVNSPLATYADSDVSNGQTYYYKVAAIDDIANESLDSSQVSGKPDSENPTTPGKPTITPSVSTLGDFILTNSKKLTFSWSASTDDNSGISAYYISIGSVSGQSDILADRELVSSTTSFEYEFANAGKYFIRIYAKDRAGNRSSNSPEVAVIVDDSPPTAPSEAYVFDVSDRVSGVYATAVSWNSSIDTISGLKGYIFYRNGFAVNIGTNLLTGDIYTDEKAGISYYFDFVAAESKNSYAIKAVDNLGNESVQVGAKIAQTDLAKLIGQKVDNEIISIPSSVIGEGQISISDIKIDAIDSAKEKAGVKITWKTTVPSSSMIEYGSDKNYSSKSDLDSGLNSSHTVILTDLNFASNYHFRVSSVDKRGQSVVSEDQTFTTNNENKQKTILDIIADTVSGFFERIYKSIDGLFSLNITKVFAADSVATPKTLFVGNISVAGKPGYAIYWPKDKGNVTLLRSENGGAFTSVVQTEKNFYLDFSVKADATYTYKIGDMTSGVKDELSGKSAISSIKIESGAVSKEKVSVVVSFKTDKLAKSQVFYGEGSVQNLQTDLNESLNQSHTVLIEGLKPKTSYSFRLLATDKSGVEKTTSEIVTFVTPSPPTDLSLFEIIINALQSAFSGFNKWFKQ